MTERDKLKKIIIKALESADNGEIAEAYYCLVGCGACPYWRESDKCGYNCYDYILEKLEEEEEEL